MKKKLFAVAMCIVMVVAMAAPAFAAANDVVTSCYNPDTSHPWAFFTQRSTASEVMNQYTASQPVAGTPLTTWYWTGDQSQWFEDVVFTANGSTGNAWAVYCDPTLVINCRRVGSAPEVNIESAIGNYRADIEMTFPNTGYGKFQVAPRYIHSTTMAITVGAPMTNGHYLNWTPTGSTFYMYEVGTGRFV